MADIIITIPNAQIGRAVDALCSAGDYAGDPDDLSARRAFAKAMIARYVRQTVLQAEREQAMANAMSSVTVTVDAIAVA